MSRSLIAATGIGVFAAMLLAACASTTESGAVGANRSQFLVVSSEQMNQGAVQEYSKVLQQAQSQGALNRDAAQTERVRRIAQRLIPQTKVFRPDALSWKWEVNLISSKDVNAWCMPGGKIAVYTALIERLNITEDELAAVMGHEIAHALREHSRERASQMMASQAVVGIGAAVLGIGQAGANLGNMVAQVTFNLPNSRGQETEADRIGVELAARAGYDPRAAITLWQKMGQLSGGGGGPNFMSTHPSPETRQSDLDVYAKKVMPLYEEARKRSALEVERARVASARPTLGERIAALR